MSTELENVKAEDFGLESKKTKSIEEAFLPKISERNGLAEIYDVIIKKDITPELSEEARDIRLKLVKVRSGISEIHKSQKSFFLASGKFVDAWKKKETLPCSQMEEKLLEIEKHSERIEAERKAKLKESREDQLHQLDIDTDFFQLDEMPEDSFKVLLENSQVAFKAKKEEAARLEKERILEEKRVKDERIETERLDKLENTRNIELAPYIQFFTGNEDTRLMPDSDYSTLLKGFQKAKLEYQKEQEAIQEENEKLRKQAEQVEAKRIKDERARQTKEGKERAIREENDRKERAVTAALFKKQQAEKAKLEAELQAKRDQEKRKAEQVEADKQAELNKGDAAKIIDLITDLQSITTGTEFKSEKNKKMYRGVCELIGKVVNFVKN